MTDPNDKLDENFDEIQESDETDWKSETNKLREKAIRQREKTKTLRDSLKEAEVKLMEFEKSKPSKEEKSKPDEELLKRLDNLALKASGIKEAYEVELFNKWKTDTGRDTEGILDSSIFRAELEGLRTSKANQTATSNIKGEPGTSAAKSEPDYWISKATKGPDGNLMFPEEMPKELYTKVLDKLEGEKKGTGELRFYNDPKAN